MANSATLRLFRFARNAWQNSPWVVIAVMAHVTLGAALSIVSWRDRASSFDETLLSVAPSKPTAAPIELPPEEPPIDRTPPPPDEIRELVTPMEALIDYVPTDQLDLTEPIGDPDLLPSDADFSPSASSNIGTGGPGVRGSGPSTRGPSRGKGTEVGGRPPIAPPQATQEAVLLGMRWLARHQQEDGSWSIARLGDVCADPTCRVEAASYTEHYDEGLTGLALLAFLGAGYHHASPELLVDPVKARQHRVGDIVKAGLRALTSRQKDDGSFSATRPFLYNEALCTMALCEAYWLSGARPWRESAERAVAFIVAAQKRSPRGTGFWGWRYGPREDVTTTDLEGDETALAAFESDLSVSTWAVMALKSAQLAGLDVPQESLDGALEFVHWVSRSDGRAGYLTPDGAGLSISGVNDHFAYHTAAMSALSMCARTFLAHDASDPFLEAGARQLVRDLPVVSQDRLSVDYYYWYYGSLALNQFDGPDSPAHTDKYWGPWNQAMADALVGLQERERGSCSQGAWLVPDRWSYTGGPVYTTALNVLTLEVYYRYENAFGVRDERAKKAPGKR
ncbi:MAG: hypothetical protein IT453_20365 [Planctomycetes bacterium]|nr:hypothetical protein [Planctomycetota bacterium]